MDSLPYSTFRANLAKTLDKVHDDHKPVTITRQNGKASVVMSLEDFQSYEETAYLLSSANNAARLNQAIADIEAGKTVEHDLLEDDEA